MKSSEHIKAARDHLEQAADSLPESGEEANREMVRDTIKKAVRVVGDMQSIVQLHEKLEEDE